MEMIGPYGRTVERNYREGFGLGGRRWIARYRAMLGAEIIPTLRLWTVNDDTPDDLLEQIYPLDKLTDDTVLYKDARKIGLHSPKTAFRRLARDWKRVGLNPESR